MSKIDQFWLKKHNGNYTCNFIVFELQNTMVLFVYIRGKVIRICLKGVKISLLTVIWLMIFCFNFYYLYYS